VVSRTPVGPLLRGAAGVLTALTLLAAVTLLARRRSTERGSTPPPPGHPGTAAPPFEPEPGPEPEPERHRERVGADTASG